MEETRRREIIENIYEILSGIEDEISFVPCPSWLYGVFDEIRGGIQEIRELLEELDNIETSKGYIVVGKHKFTGRQVALLEAAGLLKEVCRFKYVKGVSEVIQKAKELGADAIVVQELPIHLLVQLLHHAQRAGIPVYTFKIEQVGFFNSEEEAKESGADIIVPTKKGTYRAMKTVALQKITIETEDVATL